MKRTLRFVGTTDKRKGTARAVAAIPFAVMALAVTGAANAAPPAPSFAPVQQLPSGGPFPYAVTVVDLNHDSIPDMAVANSGGGGAIGVLLGTGEGAFQAPITYASNIFFAASIASGDLNGDGDADIVTSGLGGEVAVLLGEGDGSFLPPAVSGPTGPNSQLTGVEIADLNGDTNQDVVLSDRNGDIYNGGKVVVMLGDGEGNLASPSAFPTETQGPTAITAADFNGDEQTDVALSSVYSSAITVLLGNGAGGFGAPTSYLTGGTYSYSVASGDFNGDGNVDLAASNLIGAPVAFILGDGQGDFGSATPLAATECCGSLTLAAGDVNGDGVEDIAAGIGQNVDVWASDGSGGLSGAIAFPLGPAANPIKMTVADASGDGLADIAVAENDWNGVTGTVSLLVNTTETDNTSPTITVPGPITVAAPNANSGALVSYVVSVSDPDDAASPAVCEPPSGSVFPVGSTIVTCSSSDTHGNASAASFRITVTTPGADCQLSDYPLVKGSAARNLKSANLGGCYLAGVNLAQAKAASANLRSADLTGAVLSGADLSGANLSKARLADADLSGANVSGANLKGAEVGGANLSGVVWSRATCPDGTAASNGGTCIGHLG